MFVLCHVSGVYHHMFIWSTSSSVLPSHLREHPNFKRLAPRVMHSSFPVWFIVRTFHVEILVLFRRLHAVLDDGQMYPAAVIHFHRARPCYLNLQSRLRRLGFLCSVVHSVLGDCTAVRPPILVWEFVVEVFFRWIANVMVRDLRLPMICVKFVLFCCNRLTRLSDLHFPGFEINVFSSPRSLNNFALCRKMPRYRNVPRAGIIRVVSNERLCAGIQG